MNAGSGNLALKKKTIGIATNQKYTSARLLEVTNTTQNTGWLTTAWLAVFKNKMTVIISNKKKRLDKEEFLPIMIYSLQYFVKEFNDLHLEVI